MNWRRAVFLAAGVLVLASAVAYWVLEPRVEAVSPVSGTENTPRDVPLRITFTHAMRQESVEERLSILPVVEGRYLWEGNTLVFTPDELWPQGAIVTVELKAGARSKVGLALNRGAQWSFQVAPTLLAYLWPAGEAADIYAMDLETGDVQRLTDSAGVLDFDVNPEGSRLYYSVSNESGGSDLYAFDRFAGTHTQLLDCGADACSSARISPDEGWLSFERLPVEVGEETLEIWALDLESDEAERVSPEGHQVRFPLWSPEGLLSYYDATEQAYAVVDLVSGESTTLPNETGEAGAWSTSGLTFVAPEFYLLVTDTLRGPTGEASLSEPDESTLEPVEIYSSHLLAYDRENGRWNDLTRSNDLEDTAPSFSLDGDWLAFARRYVDVDRWTPGRQLWVMRPDGSEARPLTNAPDYKYTEFAWRPDGTQIAVLRFNQVALTEPPEIWLVFLDGRPGIRLVIGGYAPQWIP